MRKIVSAEVALTAACCTWPPSDAADDQIRRLAATVTDWARFDAVVRKNRVSPLVHRAVRRTHLHVPDELICSLASRAAIAAKRALVAAQECVRLTQACEAAGLPSMIIKGIPQAVLSYGDIGMKEAKDIDLLVAPDQVLEAHALLLNLGYSPRATLFMSSQFARVVPHSTEASFYNERNGVYVDLHWKIVDSEQLMGEVDVRSSAQYVTLPIGTIRTLNDEALFAYLCLHGTIHNWSRLKWLADLAGFLSLKSEDRISDLFEAAGKYGAARSASVSICLARELLGLTAGEKAIGSISSEWQVTLLKANALATLNYRGGSVEHKEYSGPWMRQVWGKFLLTPGYAFALEQLGNLWISPVDRARIRLPARWAFLYHVLRIPLWLGRAGRRLVGAWLSKIARTHASQPAADIV